MATIKREKLDADGRVEVYVPHRYQNGRFVVAKRDAVNRNEATNQIEVATEPELIPFARTGDYCIRMSCGDGAPKLIAPGPDGYQVVD